MKASKKISITSVLIFIAFYSFAQTQIEMQGNVSIADDLQTESVEGSLSVSGNLSVGGTFLLPRLSFYPQTNAAILIGNNADVLSGKWGIALGSNSYVTANGAMAIGNNAKAFGNNSLAVGYSAKANNDSAVAYGANTTANGEYSQALGYGSISTGNASLAAGVNALTSGVASFAFGKNVSAESFLQTTIGQLNERFLDVSTNSWVETEPLFVVANGNGAVRSNALVILKNGNAQINGKLTVLKPSTALPMGEFGRPAVSSE